jgi:hypothetical protein
MSNEPSASAWILVCSLPLCAFIWLTSCGLLLTGSTDPAKVQAIMDSTNARGCIYARASATPWASASTILVGTWGDPPPSLKECWQTLPPATP